MEKQDLTQGKVSQTLIKYATPMIITSLFQSVYSIVDIIIAGHYIGGKVVSAINNASLVLNLLTQIAIGLTVGGNVLISQYFGAKKVEDIKKTIGTLLLGSFAGGIAIGLVIYLFAGSILQLLGAPSLDDATIYLKICAMAIPSIFGYNAISAILRALGNSKVTMYFIIISSVLNVILDVLLVVIMHMGISGAAIGTATAQLVSCVVAIVYLVLKRETYLLSKEHLRFDFRKAGQIFRLGIPIALQWTVASISWLGVAFLINKGGVDISAGNGISSKIKDFCQLFISAVVSAGSTMAAQNLGAGEYERGRKVMWTCMKMNLLISTVLIVITEIFAPWFVSIFTKEPAVAHAAIINLRIEIIAQWFYVGFMTFNVLATGAGDTLFVMANSFLNCIIVRLILAFVLERNMGVLGVYLACLIAPLSSVPVGFWYYKSEKWKKSIVRENRRKEGLT